MSQIQTSHTESISQISMIADLVISALQHHGIYQHMSTEQQNVYIPQFVRSAEERVGLELWGDLSPKDQELYVQLIAEPTTTGLEITTFWHTHHPRFEARVTEVLEVYIEDLINAFLSAT